MRDFLDEQGYCKVVSQKDVDLIRVNVDDIESTTDKEYLLEKLYRYIDIVNAALEMLGDPKTATKVKQKREELLQLQESLQEARHAIMEFRIQPKTYGLYVKYPRGYEG